MNQMMCNGLQSKKKNNNKTAKAFCKTVQTKPNDDRAAFETESTTMGIQSEENSIIDKGASLWKL